MMFGPSSGNVNKWYVDMCDYSAKRKPTCDYCDTIPKLPQHYIQTPSYYRNEASGDYFFCSSECSSKFENEKICKHCHYRDSALKKPEGRTFMLCTSHPCGDSESCYNKYIGTKCSFCWDETDLEKLTFRCSVNKLNYYSCNDCFAKYKNIVLKDDEIEQPNDADCIFCYNKTDDGGCVNGYYLCEPCIKTYKIFVFGNTD